MKNSSVFLFVYVFHVCESKGGLYVNVKLHFYKKRHTLKSITYSALNSPSFHSALLPDPQKKDVDDFARKSQSRAAVFFWNLWYLSRLSYLSSILRSIFLLRIARLDGWFILKIWAITLTRQHLESRHKSVSLGFVWHLYVKQGLFNAE